MNRGYVAWPVVLMLLLFSCVAQASNESLSFQRAASGHIEAVVSGLDDGPGCVEEFVAADDIEVDATVVSISSPSIPELCTLPLAPVPYQVVADLGVLGGDRYDVTWEQGSLSVFAVLVPADLDGGGAPAPVPAFSWLGVLMLVLALVAVAAFRIKAVARR